MNKIGCFFIASLAVYSAAHAQLFCTSSLSGTINSDVIIDGTVCTFEAVTLNGDISVINGGSLTVKAGSILDGRLTAGAQASVVVFGTVLNGRIRSDDSTELAFFDSAINGRIRASGLASFVSDASIFDKDVSVTNAINTSGVFITGSSLLRGALRVQTRSSVLIYDNSTVTGKFDVEAPTGNTVSGVFLSGATIGDEVILSDVDNVEITSGTAMKQGMSMTRVRIVTFAAGTTVDGQINDVGGAGPGSRFVMEGARFTSSLTVTDRIGDVSIGGNGGSQTIINGQVTVQGGHGSTTLNGIDSYLLQFSCNERQGRTQVSGISGSGSMFFTGCESVVIDDTVVNDRLSILDAGAATDDSAVVLEDVTCRNLIQIKNSIAPVTLTDVRSNNRVELENNSKLVTLSFNQFNTIQCINNPILDALNNRANQVIGNCGFN